MRNLYRIDHKNMTDMARMAIDLELELGTLIPVESTKLERKLQCALNRISKLIPSVRRISELDRIAVEMDAEADRESERIRRAVKYGASYEVIDSDGLRADALYLRRLEYDLTSMREAKTSIAPKKEQTMKAGSKYDPVNWPRGARP